MNVRLRDHPALVVSVGVMLPLLLTALLLLWRPWAPVLDMAMTELRVRDVGGRHTPLIGLPGRIGDFPDQGSHPGPWSFYLLAPFHLVAGRTAWGLELGSVVINSATIAVAIWLGRRRAGTAGVLAIGAVMAVALRGYGLTVLTHPWNPYFPVLLWILVLLAAWSVLCGDHWMALPTVAAASIAAQTHVPYLVGCVAMCALVLITMARRWHLAPATDRRNVRRPLLAAIGVGAFFWLPPLVDQLRRDPGNITMLVRHFTSDQPDEAIGTGAGVRLFFRHLDAPAAFIDLISHGDAFVHRSGLPRGSGIGGMIVFGLWIVAVVIAYRRSDRRLLALHQVLAVALAAGAFSMTRIFGKVWFYLTLWAWGTMLLVVASLVWTAWIVARDRDHEATRQWWLRAAVATTVIATVGSLGAAVVHEVPEPHLSDGLRAVLPATTEALDAGVGAAVGADGTYLVFWQDAVFIGAQGYGLVNELERRGYQVGVHPTWRVPVTHHRVLTPDLVDAEIHLVSGENIAVWRGRVGYSEVVEVDVRTDDERVRFDELRQRVGERLVELGRTELIPVVDGNLFGASLDPDLPDDVIADLSEMLVLAEPVAIFIAPSGSTF